MMLRPKIILPLSIKCVRSPAPKTCRWWCIAGAQPRSLWPCWPVWKACARWFAPRSRPTSSPPTLNKIRTGLHLPEFLDHLGIKSLTAYVDNHADWWNKLYDDGLRLYPVPLDNLCNNPVCHRITFMYAPLYEHAQLNDVTHEDALHEMFGIANIKAFDQIALMTRKGHIVAADGSEAYMPNLKRLAIPDQRSFMEAPTPVSFRRARRSLTTCFAKPTETTCILGMSFPTTATSTVSTGKTPLKTCIR